MRQTIISFSMLLAFAAAMTSCNNKVNLYADYKDIPVVYGLLDMTKDTNYVKIIRAFSGNEQTSINANEIALIPDSNNYPGKLDAKIIEYRHQGMGNNYVATGNVFELDTMTIHDKESGVFYAPNQKVYFTTGKFKPDEDNGTTYKYKLEIKKGNDTVSSETGIVGGESFKIITSNVDFDPNQSSQPAKIKFVLARNAAVYEFVMEFNYQEKLPNQPLTDKKIKWSLGRYDVDKLSEENNAYFVPYNRETFWVRLADAIGGDTLNAVRYVGDFNLYIAAGGSELNNYIEVNTPSSSISQTLPDYTNITGGYGVFSSRVNISRTMSMSNKTRTALVGKTSWGFIDTGK